MHGGFALTPVMGSETTYLRSGFGGFEGRALATVSYTHLDGYKRQARSW